MPNPFSTILQKPQTASSQGNKFSSILNNSEPVVPVSTPAPDPLQNPKYVEAKKEADRAKLNSDFQNSFLGTLRNTYNGLTKATVDVAKNLGQYGARVIGTAGITLGNATVKAENLFLPKEKEKPLPFDSEIPTNNNRFTNALFGGEPIRDVTSAGQNIREQGAQFKSNITGNPYEAPKENKALNTVLGIGGLILDLSGFGGKTAVKSFSDEIPEQFFKFVAKEKSPKVLEDTLKSIGVDDINAKSLSQKLAPTATVDEAKSILTSYATPKPTENPFSNILSGEVKPYEGESDITTKILKDLEGKTTVSKQYILDATNRGELKQAERDITRNVLDTMKGDTINVQEFADKVKAELLPLNIRGASITQKQAKKELDKLGLSFENDLSGDGYIVDKNGEFVDYLDLPKSTQKVIDAYQGGAQNYGELIGNTKYEGVTLPAEQRGNVKNYKEHIWESPIKTKAGSTHFGGATDNYFGHTRIEDMADNKTRRVIEVQSDLYQKGNLEQELPHKIDYSYLDASKIKQKPNNGLFYVEDASGTPVKFAETKAQLIKDLSGEFDKKELKRIAEVKKLQQYNDPTAHFRMIREEIKKAAQDGKTKLQFPTGETAMKIEGLGSRNNWVLYDEFGENLDLTEDLLKVGKEVKDGAGHWIITDVLGDGKFKAVPLREIGFTVKNDYELNRLAKEYGYLDGGEIDASAVAKDGGLFPKVIEKTNNIEQFDISGKVDTNNPIYKFYEKDVQKYLNKFGGKRVVDDKGVSWIEIPITKEQGKAPVEAFNKRNLFPKDISITSDEARKIILDGIGKEGYTKNDLKILFSDEFIDDTILGSFEKEHKILGNLIRLYEKDGKVGLITALHESKHFLFSKLSPEMQKEAFEIAKKEIGPMYRKILENLYKDSDSAKYSGELRENALLEEYIVDKWAKSDAEKEFGYKKSVFSTIFDALDNLLKKIVEIYHKVYNRIKNTPNKEGGFIDFSANTGKDKNINQLISEGKIRVVSRNGKDIYQYKKGLQWVNARDEDSAIKQVTKEPSKPKPKVYSDADQQKIDSTKFSLEMVRERLAEHPARPLLKFIDKKEGDFLDFKNPNLAKNNYESNRIIEKNKKIMKEAENAFADHPEITDKFDNPDVIREVIDDYFDARKTEKSLVATKNYLEKTLEPIKATSSPFPKVSSQIDTTTGEGRSIEIQANQAQDILSGEPFAINASLPKIIENTVTNVQKKVHIIDTYLTTPHFVMEKIGFGKEAEMLRDGMDAYWKELPKNLDIITKWSKEASKDGNKDIFQFLDGEAIELKPQDKKIALEIKDWLKEWAVRLKLPADNTISHYITHIFDKELIAKEFDEDLAKIIADKIPGQVYDPFLLKRLGKKGYKQDTWAALDAYVKRGTRKVNVDPALEKIQDKAGSSLEYSNIEKSQFNYIKKYIDNINMRPNEAEEGIDNFIKSVIGYKLGQRPTTSILKFFRQATFRGMLGLNPASALRNLSQGINTYATLGEKHTALGYLKLFSKGAGEELAREGVLNAGFVQDRALNATKKAIEKMDKVLFVFFDRAEKINRGAAYFGAKSKALSQGKTEEEAIKYAKETVRKTQFSFDSVDTPVGMSGDLMKTLTQFQTFTTKQLEFLGGMAKRRDFAGLIRYVLAGIAFTYTIGKAFGMEPKEILPWYRFETPPSLKFPVETLKAVFNTPNKYGQERSATEKLNDVGKAGLGLIPAGSQMRKTFQGTKSVLEGGSFDKGGKLQFQQGQSTVEKIQSILFGKYASDEAKAYFDKPNINKKQMEKIKPIYDEAHKLINEGKDDEAQSLIDNLSDEDYALYKKYRTAEMTKATIKGKKDIIPKYLEIQKLKTTNPEKAKEMLDALTDDEYKYYTLVKKQLESK